MLTRLSPIGNGWWPAPEDTARDRDPAFDSVIAIWQPTVTDQATHQTLWIGIGRGPHTPDGHWPNLRDPDHRGGDAGRTPQRLQTRMGALAALLLRGRGVFAKSNGHEPRGRAAVRELCGRPNLRLEGRNGDADPIPNSIDSNESGFTHDYYSGTAALATDPLRCLGIGAASWATGGPVSQPGNLERPPSGVTIDRIRALLQQLADRGILHSTLLGPLGQRLDDAARALSGGDVSLTINLLTSLRHELLVLQTDRRLLSSEGNLLIVFVDLLVEELGRPQDHSDGADPANSGFRRAEGEGPAVTAVTFLMPRCPSDDG